MDASASRAITDLKVNSTRLDRWTWPRYFSKDVALLTVPPLYRFPHIIQMHWMLATSPGYSRVESRLFVLVESGPSYPSTRMRKHMPMYGFLAACGNRTRFKESGTYSASILATRAVSISYSVPSAFLGSCLCTLAMGCVLRKMREYRPQVRAQREREAREWMIQNDCKTMVRLFSYIPSCVLIPFL